VDVRIRLTQPQELGAMEEFAAGRFLQLLRAHSQPEGATVEWHLEDTEKQWSPAMVAGFVRAAATTVMLTGLTILMVDVDPRMTLESCHLPNERDLRWKERNRLTLSSDEQDQDMVPDGPGPRELALLVPNAFLFGVLRLFHPASLKRLTRLMLPPSAAFKVNLRLTRFMFLDLEVLSAGRGILRSFSRAFRPTEAPLLELYTSVLPIDPDGEEPILEFDARLTNQTTSITIDGPFNQAFQERRLRCIRHRGTLNVAAACGWRARLVDLTACSAGTVYCDAVVALVKSSTPFDMLRGAAGLMVVRIQAEDTESDDWATLVCNAYRVWPDLQAIQVELPDGDLTTVFPQDRVPKALGPLMDLAVALGIASGDNGNRVNSDVQTMQLLQLRGRQPGAAGVPGEPRVSGSVIVAMMHGLIRDISGDVMPSGPAGLPSRV